jgi:hypothetical protein
MRRTLCELSFNRARRVLYNKIIIVTIVKELEKIYSEKLLNLDKVSLNFQKCRNILKTRR